jgi:hypothetical protein
LNTTNKARIEGYFPKDGNKTNENNFKLPDQPQNLKDLNSQSGTSSKEATDNVANQVNFQNQTTKLTRFSLN